MSPVALFFGKLVEIYPEKLPSVEELSSNEELVSLFPQVKTGGKKKSPPPEERQGKFDETKCHARVWKSKPGTGGLGYDNIQCSSNVKEGCFCNKHHKLSMAGNLWLGKVTEDRPEKPVGPPSSKNPRVHEWCTDIDGNEIVKEKRKSGGKKSGKKKEKLAKDLTKDELLALLRQKDESPPTEEEEEKTLPLPLDEEDTSSTDGQDDGEGSSSEEEDEEDIYEMINVDGVDYQRNKDNNCVIRVSDFENVGKWNSVTSEIDFNEE